MPIASTSSLSNWLIGKPCQLASTGVRSSRVALESSTPHGCSAMWRGRPSSRSTRSNSRSNRACAEPGRAQLGQLGDRVAGVAGPDVRERVGDRVDLGRRQAERGTGVADGVPHPVGVHHRHAADPLAAEALQHPLVDLGAAGGLDVESMSGSSARSGVQNRSISRPCAIGSTPEMPSRWLTRLPAPEPRAATRTPIPDQVADLGDGEEVGGVARAAAMVASSSSSRSRTASQVRLGRAGVAAADAGLAARAQHGVGLGVGAGAPAGDQVGLGQVDRADAEVAAGVEPAPVGDPRGAAQQLAGAVGAQRRRRSATRGAARPSRRCRRGSPAAVVRSRWRVPSGTSRRAASSTSAVAAPSGVA